MKVKKITSKTDSLCDYIISHTTTELYNRTSLITKKEKKMDTAMRKRKCNVSMSKKNETTSYNTNSCQS